MGKHVRNVDDDTRVVTIIASSYRRMHFHIYIYIYFSHGLVRRVNDGGRVDIRGIRGGRKRRSFMLFGRSLLYIRF